LQIGSLWIAIAHLACAGEPAITETDLVAAVDVRLTTSLRFEPAEVRIRRGEVVRWINDASMFHTITPDEEGQSGVWIGAPVTSAGQVFTHQFTCGWDLSLPL
jgi:plastocyanin